MRIVHLLVSLTIDSDDEEEVDLIIQECDYNFSCKLETFIGRRADKEEKIISTEIKDYTIL